MESHFYFHFLIFLFSIIIMIIYLFIYFVLEFVLCRAGTVEQENKKQKQRNPEVLMWSSYIRSFLHFDVSFFFYSMGVLFQRRLWYGLQPSYRPFDVLLLCFSHFLQGNKSMYLYVKVVKRKGECVNRYSLLTHFVCKRYESSLGEEDLVLKMVG